MYVFFQKDVHVSVKRRTCFPEDGGMEESGCFENLFRRGKETFFPFRDRIAF